MRKLYGTALILDSQAMTTTTSVLIFVHRRHRFMRFKELREYYIEQIRFATVFLDLSNMMFKLLFGATAI